VFKTRYRFSENDIVKIPTYTAITPQTRRLCYRKDDRAMRPIYECLSCLFTESE